MGKKNGEMKIEIKRCEVGRKSTSITGQAVVQGTEGFLSNEWLNSIMKNKNEKRARSVTQISPFVELKWKAFYLKNNKKTFASLTEQDKEADLLFICMAGARS